MHQLIGHVVSLLALPRESVRMLSFHFHQEFYASHDTLNQRWLVKKAFYVQCLAGYLKHADTKHIYTCEYVSPGENPLDIALSITVKGTVSPNDHR